MAAKFINIEIGESFVKCCLTEKRKNSVLLKKAFMFPTPVGTSSDGVITDPTILGNAITAKLHENNISGVKNVIFTLVSGKIATREVMLPPAKESRIKSIIEANSKDYFPVDISRYLISYGMLKTSAEGFAKGSHLLVMAAPLQLLDGYIKLAGKLNLEIQGIDYGGNSQFQLIKAIEPKKVTMCVTVEFNSTSIIISQGDRLLLQRMLPWGGNDFIEAYQREIAKIETETSDTDEEAAFFEALETCSVPLDEFIEYDIFSEEEITRRFSRITGGIARSMDFFNSSRWSAVIDNVVVAGSCAGLAGLCESISATLENREVLLLEDLPQISVLEGDHAEIARYISTYGSSIAPVDLLPDKFKANKDKEKSDENKFTGAIVIFIACVIAGGAMAGFSLFENKELLKEKQALLSQISASTHFDAVSAEYAMYKRNADSFALLEELLDTSNRHLVEFFTEIEEKMPASMQVLSAICTDEGVFMSLQVPDFKTAAYAVSNFRAFESVEWIEVSSITGGQNEAGMSFYTFTINCLYEYTPPVTSSAQTAAAASTEESEVD